MQRKESANRDNRHTHGTMMKTLLEHPYSSFYVVVAK